MTLKILRLIHAVILGLMCLMFWQLGKSCGVNPQVTDHIPSIRDIQAMVGAKQDGRIGAETLKLWDRAICEQEARPHFEATK